MWQAPFIHMERQPWRIFALPQHSLPCPVPGCCRTRCFPPFIWWTIIVFFHHVRHHLVLALSNYFLA